MGRTGTLFTLSVLLGGVSLLVLLHSLLLRPPVQPARTDRESVQSLHRIAARADRVATDLAVRNGEAVAARRRALETVRQTIGSADRSVRTGRNHLLNASPQIMATGARVAMNARLRDVSEELEAADARVDSASETLEAADNTEQIEALVAQLNELREAIAGLAPEEASSGGWAMETLVALAGLVSSVSTMILSWKRDRRENARLRIELDRMKLEVGGLAAQPATGREPG